MKQVPRAAADALRVSPTRSSSLGGQDVLGEGYPPRRLRRADRGQASQTCLRSCAIDDELAGHQSSRSDHPGLRQGRGGRGHDQASAAGVAYRATPHHADFGTKSVTATTKLTWGARGASGKLAASGCATLACGRLSGAGRAAWSGADRHHPAGLSAVMARGRPHSLRRRTPGTSFTAC